MGLRKKPIMIRLSDDMSHRFQELCAQFRGLPPATVMRILVAAQLSKDLQVQIDDITEQIRRGTDQEKSETKMASRVSRLNTSKPR